MVGLEPTKWRDQNPLPYHLATSQKCGMCAKIGEDETESDNTECLKTAQQAQHSTNERMLSQTKHECNGFVGGEKIITVFKMERLLRKIMIAVLFVHFYLLSVVFL